MSNNKGQHKDTVKMRKKLKGEEFLERVNYLAQISEKVTEVCPSLGKYYGKVLTTISEKSSAKLDFTLKRSVCKGCHLPLHVPGSIKYRLKRRKGRNGRPVQILTCTSCGTIKKFGTDPNYSLRAQRDGEILE